jgi:hypothetical protein
MHLLTVSLKFKNHDMSTMKNTYTVGWHSPGVFYEPKLRETHVYTPGAHDHTSRILPDRSLADHRVTLTRHVSRRHVGPTQ